MLTVHSRGIPRARGERVQCALALDLKVNNPATRNFSLPALRKWTTALTADSRAPGIVSGQSFE
jgi:hypothetical protein